jgi:hypothetical protein
VCCRATTPGCGPQNAWRCAPKHSRQSTLRSATTVTGIPAGTAACHQPDSSRVYCTQYAFDAAICRSCYDPRTSAHPSSFRMRRRFRLVICQLRY